jgi:hypothetical protein
MVLLLQTPYVDVSKRPEGKSGMDFSETQPSYTQDTEREGGIHKMMTNMFFCHVFKMAGRHV